MNQLEAIMQLEDSNIQAFKIAAMQKTIAYPLGRGIRSATLASFPVKGGCDVYLLPSLIKSLAAVLTTLACRPGPKWS